MKAVIKNFFLFLVLVGIFSALTACSGTQTTPGNQAVASPSPESSKSKSDDYPPIPAAVAKATLKNLDGSTFTVADKKGKVILLNLWATWCGPCRGEMPEIIKMQDKYRDQGFEVIGVDTDDEPLSVINKFRDEMKLNYTLVWSDSDLQSELVKITNFPAIPQSFIIDRQGKLRAAFKGGSPAEVAKMVETVGNVVNE